jgi:hypothetical protein
MNRIPSSQSTGKSTEELRQGLDGEADVTSLVIRLGIERLAAEMIARGLSTRDFEGTMPNTCPP